MTQKTPPAKKHSQVRRKTRETAQGLDGPERRALEEGRRTSGGGTIHSQAPAHKAGVAADPHTEENLDRDLDETFPASDPVPISPGAD